MSASDKQPVGLRAWSILAILICFYQLSFIDKQMYSLLLNLIGKGLKLSDIQLGLIQGVGFSLFYTIGALATGWAIDRYSRRMILFFGVVFWSLGATISGLPSGFGTLLAARSAVGLGEAVLIPTAFSLIALYFPRDRLSTATGIFMSGANIGGVVAMLAGGKLIAHFVAQGTVHWPVFGTLAPWQAAFVTTGIPGVLVALLAFGIPADPARRVVAKSDVSDDGKYANIWAFCKSHKAFLLGVIIACGFLTTCAYAVIIWSPAFFERKYGWGHAQIGTVVAMGIAAGGIGNIVWGWVADRLRRGGRRDALFQVYIVLTLAGIGIAALTFLTSNPRIASMGYPFVWFVLTSFGPMLSAIQFGIPDCYRGRLVSFKTTITGLMGLSAGPIIVSLITDKIFGDKAMLGYSIVITLIVAGLASVTIMLLTRKAYVRAVIEQEQAGPAAEISPLLAATPPTVAD